MDFESAGPRSVHIPPPRYKICRRKATGLGAAPSLVSADSWYSGLENLKFLKKKELGFLIALEKNRIVSERPHSYVAVETVELPEGGKVIHLREFGFVSVFRTVDKNNTVKHYAQFDPRKKAHESGRGHLPPGTLTSCDNRQLIASAAQPPTPR